MERKIIIKNRQNHKEQLELTFSEFKIKFSNELKTAINTYKAHEESKNYLLEHDQDLKENGMMAKMGASMGIKKEVKSDNSDSSIAEMLIQGISMGSLEMEKKIGNYEKDASKEALKFAKKFLEFQEDSITGLKKFL